MALSPISAVKRKRNVLTIETKIEILHRLSTGESGSTLARCYNVGKATITGIKTNKEAILEYLSKLDSEDCAKERKTLRTANDTCVENAVYLWFIKRRNTGEPITGPLLCEKALEFNKKLGGPSDFKASSGWLKNFKLRHGIRQLSIKQSFRNARLCNSIPEFVNCEDDVRKWVVGEEDATVLNEEEIVNIAKSTRTTETDMNIDGDDVAAANAGSTTAEAFHGINGFVSWFEKNPECRRKELVQLDVKKRSLPEIVEYRLEQPTVLEKLEMTQSILDKKSEAGTTSTNATPSRCSDSGRPLEKRARQESAEEEQDDDRMFMLGLAGKMKHLSPADNMKFRLQVQQLLLNKLCPDERSNNSASPSSSSSSSSSASSSPPPPFPAVMIKEEVQEEPLTDENVTNADELQAPSPINIKTEIVVDESEEISNAMASGDTMDYN